MKVFISVDIEGAAAVASWDEALQGEPNYETFREIMTREAVAACEGAAAGGATEIWVRDAHQTGRNILPERLPSGVTLVRGWSGHPYKMLQELDESFDAVAMIGWHGPAGDGGNPLSHAMTGRFARLTLNGAPLSEYLLHAHVAGLVDVPIVFLSGDAAMCDLAHETNPTIHTAATKSGCGPSVVTRTPADACDAIRNGLAEALRVPLAEHTIPRAEAYELRVIYREPSEAIAKSFYPGARLDDDATVAFDATDAFELARAMGFL